MKKFNEFVNEQVGLFSAKENDLIGKEVTITIHKTSNDGQRDLFNQVGNINDINENGNYIIRMMMDGQLYTFSNEQVKIMEVSRIGVVGINESHSTFEDKVQKLSGKSKEENLRLIWGWIKQDSITLKEFIKLIDEL